MNTDDPVVPITALKNAAPKLTRSMSDDTLKELIHDATVNTLADGFPQPVDGKWNDITLTAIKYLALHLASMDTSAGQGILDEKVAVLERKYESKIGKDWLHSSVWGLYYYRLWKLFCGGSNRYGAVQH